jgi:imidazolonepropionase-like amidohydrolase
MFVDRGSLVFAGPAELLGMANRIGSLEAGRFADIVGYSDDPLVDIGQLRKAKFVMKGGEVVRR